MFAGKAAALFFLRAVFAVVYGPMNGTRVCTEQQKDLLLTKHQERQERESSAPTTRTWSLLSASETVAGNASRHDPLHRRSSHKRRGGTQHTEDPGA